MAVGLRLALLLAVVGIAAGQFFVNLGDKTKTPGSDVGSATQGQVPAAQGAGDGDVAAQADPNVKLQEDWQAFVKWFRSNGGIISSKLNIKVRNGRQGVYFKERMRRGETIVSFPRNLRLDEKTAMKVCTTV